jgi:hypothetical protein
MLPIRIDMYCQKYFLDFAIGFFVGVVPFFLIAFPGIKRILAVERLG